MDYPAVYGIDGATATMNIGSGLAAIADSSSPALPYARTAVAAVSGGIFHNLQYVKSRGYTLRCVQELPGELNDH